MIAKYLQDQSRAAVAEAREIMAATPGEPVRQGGKLLAEELWWRYKRSPRCAHLAARPFMPAILLAPEAVWRCRECARQRGWPTPSACHRCDEAALPGALTPVVLRADQWVFLLALCSGCLEAERGRS